MVRCRHVTILSKTREVECPRYFHTIERGRRELDDEFILLHTNGSDERVTDIRRGNGSYKMCRESTGLFVQPIVPKYASYPFTA